MVESELKSVKTASLLLSIFRMSASKTDEDVQ